MEYKMSTENYRNAILDILILTYARQDALIHLVIDKLVEKGEDEKSIVASFDEDFLAAEKQMRELIYANAGDPIDLSGLFGRHDKNEE